MSEMINEQSDANEATREGRAVDCVDVEGGRIAYEVIGNGLLVVMSPGMVDIRSTYRFLAPLIADGGYRVASVDLRGHGDSSTSWKSSATQTPPAI